MTEMRKTDLVGKTGKGPGKYVRKEGLGKQAPGELCVRSPSGVSPLLRLTFHGNTGRGRESLVQGRCHRGGAISNGL